MGFDLLGIIQSFIKLCLLFVIVSNIQYEEYIYEKILFPSQECKNKFLRNYDIKFYAL